MTKQTGGDIKWGTPEHEAWELATYGPRSTRNLHDRNIPGCKCQECKRGQKWLKGYQKFLAKVDR